MAKRRRLSRTAAVVGSSIGDVSQMMLQNELLKRRQLNLAQQMQDQQLVKDYTTTADLLMDPTKVQEQGPDVIRTQLEMKRNLLPPHLQSRVAAIPDLNALDRPMEERVGLTRRKLQGVSNADDPLLSSDALAADLQKNRGRVSQTVTGDQGISVDTTSDELDQLIAEMEAKKSGLLAAEPADQEVEFLDEAGVKQKKYVTKRQLGSQGTLQQERTASQEGARERTVTEQRTRGTEDALMDPANVDRRVDFTRKTKQGELDVTNDPKNQAAAARGAAMETSARKRAELAAELQQMGITGQQQAAALALADDFQRDSADFMKRRDSWQNIAKLSTQDSRPSEIALVFNFMKMQDPTSTVSASEQATAANAAGVPDAVRSLWNRILSGERMQPGTKREFALTAQSIYESALKDHQGTIRDYTTRATGYRVPPNLIIREVVEPEGIADPLIKLRESSGQGPAGRAVGAGPQGN